MSRSKAKALLVLERLESVLVEDIATEPEKWFAAPATVTIQPTAATRDSPRPLVAIEANSSEPGEEGVTDLGPVVSTVLHCTAYLETQDTANPQAAGLELDADFWRFLARHPQLEAADGVAWLDCGWVRDQGSVIIVDFQDGGAGAALVEFKFDVEYQRSGETG